MYTLEKGRRRTTEDDGKEPSMTITATPDDGTSRRKRTRLMYTLDGDTHTTAGGDGDLDAVAARLTDVLQVERFVRRLVLTTLYVQRDVVDADGNGRRPVGVHVLVLMVETLEL